MKYALLLLLVVACQRDHSNDPVIVDNHVKITPIQGEDDSCDPKQPKLCMGKDVVECRDDGHLGRRLRACHRGCTDGACDETCQDDNTKLIYIVSTSNDFLGFDPRKLPGNPIKRIGKLDCEPWGGSPFAMSIDRQGVAWVEYDDGSVYNVNITTAECKKQPRMRHYGVFTLAFSGDDNSETLFTIDARGTPVLSAMDPKDQKPHTVGDIVGESEEPVDLTGTGGGRLFGFFSSYYRQSYVQELSPKDAKTIGKRMPFDHSLEGLTAWAFAQWGGSLYLFTSTYEGSSVNVLDPQTGRWHTAVQDLGYRISGAGVSTCAPERDMGNGSATP